MKCNKCGKDFNPEDEFQDEDDLVAGGGLCFDCADEQGLLVNI